jgi:hypothetical protein
VTLNTVAEKIETNMNILIDYFTTVDKQCAVTTEKII